MTIQIETFTVAQLHAQLQSLIERGLGNWSKSRTAEWNTEADRIKAACGAFA